MIIPNKIKKIIEEKFVDIDQWQTNIAVFISWKYNNKDYCLSYSDLSKKFIISDGENRYFKYLSNANEVVKELERNFKIHEKCNC